MEKISVIVPVWNVERYLEKCLISLVNQTYQNLEIIVINDGTEDNSQAIIDDFTKNYDNIKSYIKPNGGLADARNYGLKKATGDYIGFVDSDDYIDLQMFEKLYDKIISNNFDIVVTDLYRVFDEKLIYTTSHINNDLITDKDIKKSMINFYPTVTNKLYKKELFDNLEFKKGFWFEDVELLYRMYPRFKKIGVIKEPLYFYVQREGAFTYKVNDKIYHYIDNWNGIINYYKNNNLFSIYQKELEYSYVRYIYGVFIKRVWNFDYENYKKALDMAIKNVKSNFKKYRRNKLFYTSLKNVSMIFFNRPCALLLYKLRKLIFIGN